MTPIRKGGGANPVEIFGEGVFKQRVYIGTDLVWQKNPDAGVWVFTHDGSSYQLQTFSAGTYNCDVEWGDGTTDTITAWNQTEVTHSYSGTGPWTVRVSGTFKGVRSNTLSKAHCLEIKNWGCLQPTDGYWFLGHTRMTVTATDIIDLTYSTTMIQAFMECGELVNLPNCDKWVFTLGVGSLSEAFRYCYKFTGEGIGDWDISSCNSLSFAFQNCYVFNENLNGWNVSAVDELNYTFYGCSIYNQPMDFWNTGNVTSMFATLYNCAAFSQDVGVWNTAKVTSFFGVLYNTLFTGSLANWSIEAVTAANGLDALMQGAAMTTANYDATLNSWAAQAIPAVINKAHFGTSKYSSAGAASRTYLVDTEGWAITDGGLDE